MVAVAPGSPAASAGLSPGDEILSLNGEAVRDVIRYQLQADEPRVELELRRGGLERSVVVEKPAGEPLGLELASAVFDRVRTCDNHCPFCFIYQLPEGMRRSLYVKDDDYRLSFLYGNFTTLTRFTEADLERVVTEGLGPLYVSIHATDPDLRARLLRNRRGATSLRWLAAILDAGIEVHGQVVVCPGINDGAALDDTLLGILDRFPRLATVGVVPLGVSAHTTEPELRPHTPAEARAVLDTVETWQGRYLAALGRRLVFAADEYYLLAGRPFPDDGAYEGFPQHENGIGMARSLEAEVARAIAGDVAGSDALDDADAGASRPRRASSRGSTARPPRDIARDPAARTGISPAGRRPGPAHGAPDRRVRRVGARTAPARTARRRTFGRRRAARSRTGSSAATSPSPDSSRAATSRHRSPTRRDDARYLLPDVVLSSGRFLDGLTPADLPRDVEVVATDGASLVDALRCDDDTSRDHADGRRRRPPERRQVDARQPPRGRSPGHRPGEAGGDARPEGARRRVERPEVPDASTPVAGSRPASRPTTRPR